MIEQTEENIKNIEKDYPRMIRGYREGYLSWHQVVMKFVHGISVIDLGRAVIRSWDFSNFKSSNE